MDSTLSFSSETSEPEALPTASPDPPPPDSRIGRYPPAGQRPTEPRERRGIPTVAWFLLLGCGPWLLLLILGAFGMVGLFDRGSSRAVTGPSVGLIHISGIITAGASGGGPFSASSAGSESVVKLLEYAAKDNNIKAIVLRVNSPGGSPVGSQEIYDEILRIRREVKKPVIVSMGDVAASGGYYLSAAADRIFAGPGTMTASIGVIMEFPQVEGLLKRFGADMAVIKSGKFKDIGNPARSLTPAERALLQALIMEVYEQFVTAVAEGRKLPKSQVREIADGRVLTGSQAKRYKLVDELGGLRQAVAYAAKQGGLEGEPKVREIGETGLFESLFGSSETSSHATQTVQLLRLLADPRVRQAVQELTAAPTLSPR
jgi:protease IV